MTKKNAEQFNRMRDALLSIANDSPSCFKLRSQAKGAGEYKKSLERKYSEIVDRAKLAVLYVQAIPKKEPGKPGPKPKKIIKTKRGQTSLTTPPLVTRPTCL
jgi:hypothetical protein